jgi:hypothetical protein
MPFKKGQSGNPGGRPKENEEIKRLAQLECPQAIKRLAHWRDCDNARASVAASEALLDRGYGRPDQAIEHSGDLNLTHEEILVSLSTGDDAS